MTHTMERQLEKDIIAFEESMGNEPEAENQLKTVDRILTLLKENPQYTARELAGAIGISAKGIEKQLSKLKLEGRIRRVGPARGGYWEIEGL